MTDKNEFNVDAARIEKAVNEILLAVDEDPNRQGLKNTPQRIARMYAELLAGTNQDPKEHIETTFTSVPTMANINEAPSTNRAPAMG